MEITRRRRFLWAFKPWQLWRFAVLNVKILRGVDRSKRLPRFVIKYKVSYIVAGGDAPSAIVNTSKPPQVGDIVGMGACELEVLDVQQMMRPRGEFCFLEAVCRLRPRAS